MGVLHHGKVVEVTADGVMVTVPLLANDDSQFGPCTVFGPEVFVGDSVIVGQIEGNAEDLVVVSGIDANTLEFIDSATIDFTKTVVGPDTEVTATVKANSIPVGDLSDVVITSPATGEVLRYNGSNWVDDRLLLDDLSDVTVSSATTAQVIRYNGTAWVNSGLSIDDLSDAAISSLSTGQLLRYNGTVWVNVSVLDLIAATTGTDQFTVQVTGDTNKRLIINGNGSIELGPGNAAPNVNLFWAANDVLKTDDSLQVGGTLQALAAATVAGNLTVVGTSEAANYTLGAASLPRFYFAPTYCNAGGLIATSTGTEVAVPSASWTAEPTYAFLAGRLYAIKVQFNPNWSGSGLGWGHFKIRKGAASTSGTILGAAYIDVAAGFADNGHSHFETFFIKNTSGSTVSTKLSMTVDHLGGTGNMSVYGGEAAGPTYILPRDAGAVADNSGLAAMAVEVS